MSDKNFKYSEKENSFYDIDKKLGYDLVTLDDGNLVYTCISAGFLADDLVDLTEEQENEIKDAYEVDVVYCDCGRAFDADDAYYPNNCEFRVLDCEIKCLDCLTMGDLLVELQEPDDIKKAGNLEGMGEDDNFEEVATLFVDSSGWGQSGEAALTFPEAIKEVRQLMEETKGPLFAGLTGIGQFQVYVTIYKKVA